MKWNPAWPGGSISRTNKLLLNAGSYFAIGVFLYWFINGQNQIPVSLWLKTNLQSLRHFYQDNPVLSIALFAFAHMTSATLSIPGSCTFLNVLSGAVFGFTAGVFIVYPVTIISGTIGYFLGCKLPLEFLERKYGAQINTLKKAVGPEAFSFLVLSRLSPLLPYGLLNIVYGFLRVPFSLFLITTTIGVFFDVVLLNSAGALLGGSSAGFAESKRNIVIAFILLFFLSYLVKLFTKQAVEVKEDTEKVTE